MSFRGKNLQLAFHFAIRYEFRQKLQNYLQGPVFLLLLLIHVDKGKDFTIPCLSEDDSFLHQRLWLSSHSFLLSSKLYSPSMLQLSLAKSFD